ncbi:MAG: hypothetical protein J6Y13_02365 [Treponema sp.]|nr:hypothetical protein [Treponema sp.]
MLGNRLWQRQIVPEKHLSELNIVPDIFAVVPITINYGNFASVVRDIPFILEIFVTHKVDEKKAGIIKNAGIPAVDIDLSASKANTKEVLIKDIYNSVHWNYINKTIGQNFIPQMVYGSRYPQGYNYSRHRPYYYKKRW